MDKVKPGWGSVSANVGEPANPLPPGERGQAMAVAAHALEVLAGARIRLHWCVDIDRDVGPDAYDPYNPSAPYPAETPFGGLLTRFRAALDLQPWTGATCELAITARHTSPSAGQRVMTVWTLPWGVNLPRLAKAPPPVGCWRLAAVPPSKPTVHGYTTDQPPYRGDSLPDTFWTDGIPF